MGKHCSECGQPTTGGIEAHPGHVTVHMFDPHEAMAFVQAFGPDDAVAREMEEAIAQAWPVDDGEDGQVATSYGGVTCPVCWLPIDPDEPHETWYHGGVEMLSYHDRCRPSYTGSDRVNGPSEETKRVRLARKRQR